MPRHSLAVLLCLAASCGGAERDAMKRDIEGLRSQLGQMRRGNDALVVQMEDIQNRLFLLQDELDSQRTALARAEVPPRLPVIRIGPDDQDEPGGSGSGTADVTAMKPLTFQEIDEDGNIVGETPLFKEPEQAARAPGGDAFAPAPREAERAEDPAAMRLYQSAYDTLRAGRYSEAIEKFKEFAGRYPTHGYADNALYWLGEAHYAAGDNLRALDAFKAIVRDYPLGNKVPDAMLKMGLCYQNLKEYGQARTVLAQVVEIYPGSPIATTAAERLNKIPREVKP